LAVIRIPKGGIFGGIATNLAWCYRVRE